MKNENEVPVSAHTPGPWSVATETMDVISEGVKTPFYSIEIPAFCGGGIALVHAQASNPRASLANARLISAAPELLAALQLLAHAAYYNNPTPAEVEAIVTARAAIAKAEGRA